MHRGLKIFSIITSIGMLIVLMQGALVTKTQSGEGCGATWPLCFGQWIPDSRTIETLIEYSHRIVSALLGMMIIILAIWTWKKLGHMREAKFMAIMSVFFIIFQGLLGAGAVVFGQSNAILALHFGISAISFTTVVLITVLAFEDSNGHSPKPKVTKGFRNYVLFILSYVYIVMYTGAYVKHTRSELACAGFPTCNGQWFPGFDGPVGAHFLHRLAATISLIFILILMFRAIRYYKHEATILWSSIAAAILVTAQLISGITVIFTGASVTSAIIHSAIISLLFATLCYLVMMISRQKAS